MVVWDNLEICEQKLEYESFYMKWECQVQIANTDIVWEYKLKNIILDQEGNILRKELLKFDVPWYEEDFFWEDIQIDYFDRKSVSDSLMVSWGFYHDITELYDSYRLRFYEINSDFSKKRIEWENLELKYNSEKSVLEFSAEIKNFWPKNNDKVYYEIVNKYANVVWWWEFFYITEKWGDDDINWKGFEWGVLYDHKESQWYLRVYLLWVSSEPNDTYSITIDTKWESQKYDWILSYDDKNQELYLLVAYDGKRTKQNFTYKIRWSSPINVGEGSFRISQKENISISGSSKEYISEKQSIEDEKKDKSKIEVAIDKFIEKQEKKYPDIEELVNNLELTQQALTLYAQKNRKYISIIEEINIIIWLRVENYRDQIISQ